MIALAKEDFISVWNKIVICWFLSQFLKRVSPVITRKGKHYFQKKIIIIFSSMFAKG